MRGGEADSSVYAVGVVDRAIIGSIGPLMARSLIKQINALQKIEP